MKIVNSIISNVTVFTDRAQVTRCTTENLDIGEHKLIFEKLPGNVDENSFQAKGIGNFKIVDIKYKSVFFKKEQSQNRQQLLEDKRRIEDSLIEITDYITIAKREKEFAERISESLTGKLETAEGFLEPEKWEKMMELYSSKLLKSSEVIRTYSKKKRNAEEELSKVEQELEVLHGVKGKEKKVAEVTIRVEEKGSITLNLTYITYGASWRPLYDLRVDSQSKKITITYYGAIRQCSGENWNDCSVKLSTAQPHIHGDLPILYPWYLNMSEKNVVVAAPPGAGYGTYGESEEFEEGARAFETTDFATKAETTEVENNMTSATFEIPQKYTILTNNEEQKVTIAIEILEGSFEYSAVPKVNNHAYLTMNVTNTSNYTFLEGEGNVFFDNNLVSSMIVNFVSPEEKFDISLGVDENIKIEYKKLHSFEKNKGVFTKRRKMIYEYMFVIKNNKTTMEKISIYDQIPISTHEDITVTLITPENVEKSSRVTIDQEKKIVWNLSLDGGEERTIPFSFSVASPVDMNIGGL